MLFLKISLCLDNDTHVVTNPEDTVISLQNRDPCTATLNTNIWSLELLMYDNEILFLNGQTGSNAKIQ